MAAVGRACIALELSYQRPQTCPQVRSAGPARHLPAAPAPTPAYAPSCRADYTLGPALLQLLCLLQLILVVAFRHLVLNHLPMHACAQPF
jgi:hypothetical protein